MRRIGRLGLGGALVVGALSGVAASGVMSLLMPALARLQPARAREREERASGTNATVATARRAARLAGRELPEEREALAGNVVHYLYGAAWGAGYALLWRRLARRPAWEGLAFGAALWLLSDELAVTLAGLAPPPNRFPASTHLRGLAAHLAYGAVTDGGVRAAERVLH